MTSTASPKKLTPVADAAGARWNRQTAIWLLVIAATLWSTSGLFIKVTSWGSFAILSGRSLLAFLVLLLYLRHIPRRFTAVQFAGALGYVGTQLFFIIGVKLTTAANAIFLQYAAPLYVALFGFWFLRERPKRADWGAMVAIFAGMLLFFGDDLSLDGLYGNLFASLSGISMAVMILSMRSQKAGQPATTILLGNAIGFLVGAPFLLQETFTVPSVAIILYLGLIQIGLAMVLYSIAIKYVPALESSLIITLEPILTPVWVFLVLGEIPGALALIGCTLVLGAVTVRAVISASTAPVGSKA